MKAAVCRKAGKPNVLKLEEVAKPSPKENEILVKVFASSVTRGDVILRKIPHIIFFPIGLIFGFKAMKITGVEYSGEVEEVGSQVSKFKKGDKVLGTTTGLKFGGNAEYVCVPEKSKKGVIALKPNNISFSEAAVLPVGGMTALFFLKKIDSMKDINILVYGASGSVGTYAVQIAKHYGAKVAAVCSKGNMELIKSIGADHVIDYNSENITKSDYKYDVIFDAVGKISKSSSKNVLKESGKYLTVKYPTKEINEFMEILCDLISKGKIKAVIDRYYPLEQIVEAHTYVETGHKKGNVVITVKN